MARHRELGADSDGSDSGNRGEPVRDLLFHPDDLFVFFRLRTDNRDAEGLQRGGPDESGVDVGEGPEGANHQAGADEQDQREGYLNYDENAAGAMLFAALADGAAAFADAGVETDTSVFEYRNATE